MLKKKSVEEKSNDTRQYINS